MPIIFMQQYSKASQTGDFSFDNIIEEDQYSTDLSGYQVFDDGLVISVCGDGLIIDEEQCDDGNLLSGDGCSSACFVEAGDTVIGDIVQPLDFTPKFTK